MILKEAEQERKKMKMEQNIVLYNRLPELPARHEEFKSISIEDIIIQQVEKKLHFEKIYDTILDTTLYTKFRTSIEINDLHFFTLCNIKEYPEESSGLVFCDLLKKWFKLIDVAQQYYVDLAQSRSKHKVGKWPLELYKIIESTLSKQTTKSI